MRLLHTSDWHLGSRFYGRSLIDDQAYVLDQMINLARDLNPDVCLIVGDVFDQPRPSEEALELFHDTIGRLIDLGIKVVALAGPSDDFSKLHLNARWVRHQGLYLYSEPSQVLSPLSLRGARDAFAISAWCLPYPQNQAVGSGGEHPAQIGRALVETTVQRIDPNAINLFVGYVWAQGAGKKSELGPLISPGGQPVESRILEYFDYCALGGCHQPLSLGQEKIRYCGGLLATEGALVDDEAERSVTYLVIEDKANLFVDSYPLRPRRAFRVLSGSVEELMARGRTQRGDDLLILRSNETELSAEQRIRLRGLSANVVAVENSSGGPRTPPQGASLVELVARFHQQMGGEPLDQQALDWLLLLEERL